MWCHVPKKEQTGTIWTFWPTTTPPILSIGTASTMSDTVYAVYDFSAHEDDEISFQAGDEIRVIERDDQYKDGWWTGRTLKCNTDRTGLFPSNYVSLTPTSVPIGALSTDHSLRPLESQPLDTRRNPNRRSLTMSMLSLNAVDECESFISHLKQSIHQSSIKLDTIRTPSIIIQPQQPAHLSISSTARASSPAVFPLGESNHSPFPSSLHLTALSATDGYVRKTPFSSTSTLPATEISSCNDDYYYSTHQNPLSWTALQVSNWLASIGFVTYAEHFLHNEIDGQALFQLTLQTLKELDIPALGKRIQILNAIASLKDEFSASQDTCAKYQSISSFSYNHHNSWSYLDAPTAASSLNEEPINNYHKYYSSVIEKDLLAKHRSTFLHSNQIMQLSNSNRESAYLTAGYRNDNLHPCTLELNGRLPFLRQNNEPQPPPKDPEESPYISSPISDSGWISPPYEPNPAEALEAQSSHSLPDILLDDLKPVDCEGVLKTLNNASGYAILGNRDIGWSRRWMVLKNNTLYWFNCDREKDENKNVFDKPDHACPALQYVLINTGFKVTPDNALRSARFGFRISELNPVVLKEGEARRQWVFYTQDLNEARLWIRSLTKFTIFHPQHENSKHGTNGVEVIGNPRPLIDRIRVSNGPMSLLSTYSKLDYVPHEWTGTDFHSSSADHRGRVRHPLKDFRRPSLPVTSSNQTKRTIPLLNRLEYRHSLYPRSKSTDSIDRFTFSARSSGVHPPQSTPVADGSPESKRPSKAASRVFTSGNPARHCEQYRSTGDYISYINSYLPPDMHISQMNELVSGVVFLHFLQEITQKSVPLHFSHAVRVPAKFPIDFLDNWDVIISWIPALGISIPKCLSVEKLAGGHINSMVELIECVRLGYTSE